MHAVDQELPLREMAYFLKCLRENFPPGPSLMGWLGLAAQRGADASLCRAKPAVCTQRRASHEVAPNDTAFAHRPKIAWRGGAAPAQPGLRRRFSADVIWRAQSRGAAICPIFGCPPRLKLGDLPTFRPASVLCRRAIKTCRSDRIEERTGKEKWAQIRVRKQQASRTPCASGWWRWWRGTSAASGWASPAPSCCTWPCSSAWCAIRQSRWGRRSGRPDGISVELIDKADLEAKNTFAEDGRAADPAPAATPEGRSPAATACPCARAEARASCTRRRACAEIGAAGRGDAAFTAANQDQPLGRRRRGSRPGLAAAGRSAKARRGAGEGAAQDAAACRGKRRLPQPKAKPQDKLSLNLELPPPQVFAPGATGAAVMRPPGITRSGENDEFGRGVIRALRKTMPTSRMLGQVTVRFFLSETGNLVEVRVVAPLARSGVRPERGVLRQAGELSHSARRRHRSPTARSR